ncbi:putative photosystem I [Dioscorea sansibarensis]
MRIVIPLFLTIGPGDFLVHHAIALGLHTTTLILVKGALDARGSKLMPDKKDFGYSFPCDGPGRGGTCDIFRLGCILFGSFLDVKYHWMGYFLLALETHHIMAG